MLDSGDDCETGYCKPPKKNRFKKGQSGNPDGRPKKTKVFEELVSLELDQTIKVTENGDRKLLTKREVMAKDMVNDAVKGKHRTRMEVIKMDRENKVPEALEVDDGDREAFNTLMHRVFESRVREEEETYDEH